MLTPNTGIVNEYFQVLYDIDNLNYANKNLEYSTKVLHFTKAQYKVGLVAKTDVDTAIQNYATAQAQLVQYENTLYNDIDLLSISTNHKYKYQDFSQLKSNFNLSEPYPRNLNSWVDRAKKYNLTVLFDQAQVNYQKKQVSIDNSGYIPDLTLSYTHDKSSAQGEDFAENFTKVDTYTAALNWNIGAFIGLNSAAGQNTYFTSKKDKLILSSYKESLMQDIRQAEYSARSSYLNITSDISQIKAYRQAVISAKSALDAANAQYVAGTNTLINVLLQQQNWATSYANLSQSIQKYFNDRIALKQSVGQLSEKDIIDINKMLISNWKPSMAKSTADHEDTQQNMSTKKNITTENLNNKNLTQKAEQKTDKNQTTTQITPTPKTNNLHTTQDTTQNTTQDIKQNTTQSANTNNSGGLSFHTHHHYYN